MEEEWPPRGLSHQSTVTHADIAALGQVGRPGYPGGHRATQNGNFLVTNSETQQANYETVYLARDENPQVAYQKIPKQPIPVRFGTVYFCVELNRDQGNEEQVAFREPADGEHRLVVVKELRARAVDLHIEKGGSENPYKEMNAMQFFADNEHVVGCLDVLQDDQYFYIVMPFCEGGDLCDAIPWNGVGMPEPLARRHFRQILRCLGYLQFNGICHRDLSPENVAQQNGRCKFIDLGMCLRIPYLNDGHRLLIGPQRACGKEPYMAPEIFANREYLTQPFDGYAIDLWAAGTSLYAMLTGMKLYDLPQPADISFKLFIVQGALGDDEMNERIIQVMQHLWVQQGGVLQEPDRQVPIINRAIANRAISAGAKDLLHKMLRPNPADRLTLNEVMNHGWVTDPNVDVDVDEL